MTYNKETLKEAIVQKLRLNYGCTEQQATDGEMMKACAMVLRDIMAEHGVQTREETAHEEKRKVHYLSLEFLMGRSLMKNAFRRHRRAGLQGGGHLRHGAGRRSGQRRSGPPGRLLSGQHDHPGDPGDGLLHLL